MPRRLRIEFEGAIYHVMARGTGRQNIVRDDEDRRRLIDGLERSVVRHGWEVLCYVVMGNHLRLRAIPRSTAKPRRLDPVRFDFTRSMGVVDPNNADFGF